MGVWCRGVRWLGNSLLQPQPLLHPAIPRPSAHVIYSHKNVSGLFIYLFIRLGFCTNKARQLDLYLPSSALTRPQPVMKRATLFHLHKFLFASHAHIN